MRVQVSQNKEISKLTNIIKDPNSSIVSLTETIMNNNESLQSSVMKQSSTSDQTTNATTDINATNKTSIHDSSQQECKSNVVIYSIDECAKGTPDMMSVWA